MTTSDTTSRQSLTSVRPDLLPAWLAAYRDAVPVVDSLRVPGRPTGGDPATNRLRTVTNMYRRTGVLAHIGVRADEGYVLIDQANPHAVHELMMMSAGDTVRPGLHDHSPTFGSALGAVAYHWAEHCHDFGLHPVLAWSYDPATEDRESIQGEKRWHAHLAGRTPAEVQTIAERSRPAGTLPPRRRRRIVEEASVLGALLAGERLDAARLNTMEPTPCLASPSAVAALRLRLNRGWASLTESGFLTDVHALHHLVRALYERIIGVCCEGRAGWWRRPRPVTIDPAAVNLPLSRRARHALGHYLQALRPELITDITSLRDDRERATHVYPLAGLAYSVCVSEYAGGVFFHLRVNVFSDLGGAGASVVNGTTVKISKGAGTLTGEELAERARFQHRYLTHLRRGRLGGRALFPTAAGA